MDSFRAMKSFVRAARRRVGARADDFRAGPFLSVSREGSFLGPSAMMMMMLLAFDLSRCVVFFYVALALPLL
jgi:hypothetical protein